MAPATATTVIFLLPEMFLPGEGENGIDTVIEFVDGGAIVASVSVYAVDLVGYYFTHVRKAPCQVTTFPNPHDALDYALGMGVFAQ